MSQTVAAAIPLALHPGARPSGLADSVQEAYVDGVSTQKVDDLVKELGEHVKRRRDRNCGGPDWGR